MAGLTAAWSAVLAAAEPPPPPPPVARPAAIQVVPVPAQAIPVQVRIQAVPLAPAVERVEQAPRKKTGGETIAKSALERAKAAARSAAERIAGAAERLVENAPLPSPRRPPRPSKSLPPDRIAALVRQLGDDAYEKRTAAAKELAEVGLNARDALIAGLQDPDLEIRRGCRRLLAEVLEDDFQRRLDALITDEEGKAKHDLPCWNGWCEVFGKEKDARRLFVEMQKAEAALLESAELGDELAGQAFRLRWQQVFQWMYNPSPQRREPSFATLATLVFVAVDTKIKLPQDMAFAGNWANVFYQGPFQRALNEGPNKPMARKLLARWILQPTGPMAHMQKLQLAMQHQIKEGLGTAIELVKDPKNNNNNPHSLCCGIEAVARLGGKSYAALLVPLLKENRECMRHVIQVNGKQETRVTEIRDVALAWLIELTGQDHAQYEMPEAKQWLEQIRKYPQSSFNFFQMGFRDSQKREAALKKLDEWLKAHPLAEAPARPATGGTPPPAPNVAAGPPPAPPPKKADKEPAESAPVVGLAMADRVQTHKLNEARKLIDRKSYAAAAGLLGDLLSAKSDFAFKPDRGAPLYRRLKPAAEQLLGQLPPEGLAEYELQYGTLARRRLADAADTGDPLALADVVQSFFYTNAGAEAAYLLGAQYRTAGHFLRAAYYLRRLEEHPQRAERFQPALSVELAACYFKAHMPEVARAVLLRWKAALPAATVSLGGHPRKPFASDDQALAWLEAILGPQPPVPADWKMFGGGPSRNVAGEDANPLLRPKYRVPSADDALIRDGIVDLQKKNREGRRPAVPSLHPLVVGPMVLVRTATALRAVDFATGAIRWEAPLEDPLQYFIQFADADRKKQSAEVVARGLGRRLWEDGAFGTMSSDGRYVYGLECVPFNLGVDNQTRIVLADGRRQLDPSFLKSYNLLTAYDVKTGKIKWEAGGPPGAAADRLAGVFFLGPPLPLDDQLYVVADVPDGACREIQTRLYALQPATGAVLYEWVLASRDEQPSPVGMFVPWQLQETVRRGSTSPAYADGVLVCCTPDNRYVGVDLTSRSVLWVYEGPQEPVNPMNPFLRQTRQIERPDRWCDAGMTIAAGHVLLTPRNSEQLICLRLADGNQDWSVPRRDGLYVGGAREGIAVVVGRKGLRAVKLADGSPAWPADAPFPFPAVPSGRGYLGSSRYYVPLSTAEVAAVDLRTGRIVSRSRSPDGTVPGNLVSYQGAILSQGAEGLCRFDDLPARDRELETALRARPQDASLLAERGEVLLYQGRLAEAIDHLERALKAQTNDRLRRMLVDAVIEGLRLDFDAFRPRVRQIDPLLDSAALRCRILQEMALGYQRTGRPKESFDTYLQWIDLLADGKQLEDADVARRVRRDRLIQAGLADLRAAAQPDQRVEMDRRIAARLAGGPPSQGLTWFGFHPAAHAVRLTLARESLEKKEWLAAELLLREVSAAGAGDQRREAAALLANLLRAAGRPEEAAADPLRRPSGPADPWPVTAKKEMEKRNQNQPRGVNARFPLWVPDAGWRFFVAFGGDGPSLAEGDGEGQLRWKLKLEEVKIHPNFMGYLHYNSDGRLAGHMLVALLGNRVAAIDTFQGKLLWAHDSPATGTEQQPGVPQMVRRRFQMPRQVKPLSSNLPMPVAASSRYVCFEQDRNLLAVEPLTGRTLWVHDDVPADSDLFGDEEMIFATPPESSEAVVLASLDGRDLGRRTVPSLGKRIATIGRRVLAWDADPKQCALCLFDPWTQQTLWRHAFDAKAQFWPIDGREIGVLDAAGRFVVLAIDDGRPVLQSQVEPLKSCDGIVVRHSAGRYLLVTNSRAPEPNPFGDWVPPGNVHVGGRAFALEAGTGKKLWSVEVPNQMLNVFQPADLPVLMFFRRYIKAVPQPNGGFNQEPPQSQMFCIDTREGKILHNESTQGHDDQYEMLVDRAARRVEYHTNFQSVKFQFTAP